MIHLHPTKLTKQPLFSQIVAFIEEHPNCILREIKKAFPDEKRLEKSLEDYIQEGYIKREDRRYHVTLPFVQDEADLVLDKELFIDQHSSLYPIYREKIVTTALPNHTNQLVFVEETHLDRHELTLSNYFYHLQHGFPLSEEQQVLYQVLGDVNPDYALKYLTTFLLKFLKKDLVKQKRPDIFVETLCILGYLKRDGVEYCLNTEFDKENLIIYGRLEKN